MRTPTQVPASFLSSHGSVWPVVAAVHWHEPETGRHWLATRAPLTLVPSAHS